MKTINKKVFYILLVPLLLSASHNPIADNNSIIGKWKCVKHEYKGRQKFSLQQAESIRRSILEIRKNTFSYSNVKFVNRCFFSGWKMTAYDTLEYNNLELRYTKAELQKFTVAVPVDAKGEFACFNECALFYLAQDTLINICGGYTFYRVRIRN